MAELDTTFVWLAYGVTYGLVAGYAMTLLRRLRKHRKSR